MMGPIARRKLTSVLNSILRTTMLRVTASACLWLNGFQSFQLKSLAADR
jgi:hypothetical protein